MPIALTPFNDFCFLFLSIVLEGAPFILLGTLISGIIDAYLPPGLIDRWLPKNRPLAVVLSGLLGAIFPVCECTIVPVIRRLIKKGLPVSCAVTYMLSAPIINPITVVSTMSAFSSSQQTPYKVLRVSKNATDQQIRLAYEKRIKKYSRDKDGKFKNDDAAIQYRRIKSAYDQIKTESARKVTERRLSRLGQQREYSAAYMTWSRMLIAFILTVSVGMILLWVRKDSILKKSLIGHDHHEHDHNHHEHDHHEHDHHDHDHHDHDHDDHDHEHDHHDHDHKPANRPVLAMRTAMRDFIETAMYFTIGVAITAVFKAFVTEDLVMVFNQSEPVGVGLMMVLAFILSLCSTSDAFIAANFPVPQSARMAFLVYGPMMDVKLVFMYLSVFTKKFVLTLAVALFFAIGILCYIWFKLN